MANELPVITLNLMIGSDVAIIATFLITGFLAIHIFDFCCARREHNRNLENIIRILSKSVKHVSVPEDCGEKPIKNQSQVWEAQ